MTLYLKRSTKGFVGFVSCAVVRIASMFCGQAVSQERLHPICVKMSASQELPTKYYNLRLTLDMDIRSRGLHSHPGSSGSSSSSDNDTAENGSISRAKVAVEPGITCRPSPASVVT